ncbi:MAG: diacylglycerol kinase family protein [Firmicutes bacterium]|nr:diacylglycerol kinase family protein [Bacillota bacterium]
MRAKTLWQSFYYAWQGFQYALRTERNFRVHILSVILLAAIIFWLDIPAVEAVLLFAAAFAVLICELFNTAIEKTIDLYTTRIHPLAKIAKNCAAAAVLLSAIFALIAALFIILPRIIDFVR